MSAATDIARRIFADVPHRWTAVVEATEPGVIAGTGFVDAGGAPARCGTWRIVVEEGAAVTAGQPVAQLEGTATELGIAEDYVLGALGFASGIATRATQFRQATPRSISIACGGWKKLPPALKPMLRAGLAVAGVLPRLVDGDFVYMSKNAVIMLGGVGPAIKAGLAVGHGPVAVQVKTVEEALFAARHGAGIIMVDTGRIDDAREVDAVLKAVGLREGIVLAFGGGVRFEDLDRIASAGVDAIDVGRAILDAPLLDLRMRVVGAGADHC